MTARRTVVGAGGAVAWNAVVAAAMTAARAAGRPVSGAIVGSAAAASAANGSVAIGIVSNAGEESAFTPARDQKPPRGPNERSDRTAVNEADVAADAAARDVAIGIAGPS